MQSITVQSDASECKTFSVERGRRILGFIHVRPGMVSTSEYNRGPNNEAIHDRSVHTANSGVMFKHHGFSFPVELDVRNESTTIRFPRGVKLVNS